MVREQPLKDGERVAGGGGVGRDMLRGARRSAPWRAVGLLALLIGLGLWLIGARYTTLGAPRIVQLLAGLFGIEASVELPSGWSLLTLTIAIGAVISLTEFGARPRRAFFSFSLVFGLVLFLIWLMVITADISSTYIGVTTVRPDSWPLTIWLASTIWASGGWSMFLTFVPELFIIAGTRWLVRGRF